MVFVSRGCMPQMQRLLKVVALLIFATALPTAANRIDKRINRNGCGRAEPMGRVYNGKPISRENIPWIVRVLGARTEKGSGCAGSIITSNVILTAAHCVKSDYGVLSKKVLVFFNATEFGGGYAVQVEKLKVHPKFGKTKDRFYDIALLKLAVDLKFNRIMRPVCLPERDFDVVKKPLMVAGWGATAYAKYSKTILYAYVNGMKDEKCQRSIRGTPTEKRPKRRLPMICAKGNNTNACPGDSGGPMTLKDEKGRTTIVGIVSYGVICHPKYESKHTRVAFYTRWIRKVLNHPGTWNKLQFNRKIGIYRLTVA